jgi:hypothetical protein
MDFEWFCSELTVAVCHHRKVNTEPYRKGSEEYFKESEERFENGELYEKDSIKLPTV